MFLRCGNVRIFSNFLMHNRGVHIHSSMCCFSSVPFLNHEHFLKRCTNLIERRGHKFINYGETVIDMDGNPEFFDITYGWPIKHYCKCNFSSNPVHGDEILEFEEILQKCSIIPTRGVYFCQGPFVKDCLDFDVVCVDPETYTSLYDDAIKDRLLTVVLYMTICIATSILIFSITDDRNYWKRRILRDLHNLKHSLYHEQLEPPVERDDEEENEISSLFVSSTSSPSTSSPSPPSTSPPSTSSPSPPSTSPPSTSSPSPPSTSSPSPPSTSLPSPSSNTPSNEQTDEPQLATEESPNSENSSIQNETWTEWLVSLFWKSLGYSYVY